MTAKRPAWSEFPGIELVQLNFNVTHIMWETLSVDRIWLLLSGAYNQQQ